MRIAAMMTMPAAGPNKIARSTPPPRWPLVPGRTGRVKLIIWAAKTKAPITPIRGNRSSAIARLARPAAMATATAASASVAPATGTLNNSLAMCIASSGKITGGTLVKDAQYYKMAVRNIVYALPAGRATAGTA